jgi:hypothetical protein
VFALSGSASRRLFGGDPGTAAADEILMLGLAISSREFCLICTGL